MDAGKFSRGEEAGPRPLRQGENGGKGEMNGAAGQAAGSGWVPK